MEPISTIQTKKGINKKGITGSTLKIIAIISMVLDHIGAIILERILIQRGILEVTSQNANIFLEANKALYYSYEVLRTIGRISLPIFCFLIVQGFLHTHNLKKYLSRIFLFALISEIPFDLALFDNPFYWQYQNIFFTLFFSILAIAGIQIAEEKKTWNMAWRVSFGLLTIGLCLGAVTILKTDYDIWGVLIIVIMYLFRSKKTLSAGIGCIVLMEVSAFVSLIPIYLYNGKKGRNMKWIFYLFYPVHMLLLYFVWYILK